MTGRQFNPGDEVLIVVGSWFEGSYVPDDREVVGVIVGGLQPGTAGNYMVRTEHGQRSNGRPVTMIIESTPDEIRPVNLQQKEGAQ